MLVLGSGIAFYDSCIRFLLAVELFDILFFLPLLVSLYSDIRISSFFSTSVYGTAQSLYLVKMVCCGKKNGKRRLVA